MPIEVQPPLSKAGQAALVHALARVGVRIDGVSESYVTAWFRAAVREAVDREPAVALRPFAPKDPRRDARVVEP